MSLLCVTLVNRPQYTYKPYLKRNPTGLGNLESHGIEVFQFPDLETLGHEKLEKVMEEVMESHGI